MQQENNCTYYANYVQYRDSADSVDYSMWSEDQSLSEAEPSILVGPDDSDSDNS